MNQQLTNLLSNVGCAAIPMRSYASPIITLLNNQTCGENIVPLTDANAPFIIKWSAPVINENGVLSTNFTYNLFIVELLPEFDGDPNQVIQALQSSTEPRQFTVVKKGMMGSGSPIESLPLLSSDFVEPLKIGSQYVVVVQAESTGGLPLPNDGYSPVCTFTYGAEAESVEPTPDPDMAGLPPECKEGDCYKISLPATAGENVSSLSENNVVRVGCFWVTIKNVTASGGGFNGEGTVQIPFFAAKFKVELKNLVVQKFGTYLIAVSGSAEGLPDASYPTDGPVAALRSTFQVETSSLKSTTAQLLNAGTTGNLGSTSNSTVDVAASAFNSIPDIDRTIQQIANSNLESGLPIGYSGTVGEQKLRFAIFNMTFTPQNATVSMVIETPIIPGINQKLYFGAMGVCITPGGISANNSTFYLGGDLNVGIYGHTLTLKGSGSDVPEDQITYLKLKDGDFETLKLSGTFTFAPTILKPKTGTGNLVADFGFEVTDFKDLLIDLSMSTPFTIAGHTDWAFTLSELSLDLSSVKNPDGWDALPNDMKTGLGNANEQNAWTGLFAKKLAIQFPIDFKLSNSGENPSTSINNFLIGFTDGGVSFDGVASEILTLNGEKEGKLGDFAFSIDDFHVSMRQNVFTTLGLTGKLRFPIFDEDPQNKGALGYRVDLTGDQNSNQIGSGLAINIEVVEDISLYVSALYAKFSIKEGSFINYDSRAQTGKKLTMSLHGVISIENHELGITLTDMDFQNFNFDGTKLDVSRFNLAFSGLPSESSNGTNSTNSTNGQRKAGGFPVSFKEFYPVLTPDGSNWKLGLGFTLSINLVGGQDENNSSSNSSSWGFGADAGIEITTKLNSRFKPVLAIPEVNFKEIRIDVDVSVVHVIGALQFINNDPIYGNGVRGCIDVEFKLPGLPIRGGLQGMFGSKGDTRYFYIDGRLSGLNVLIPSTPIAIDGFVGGLSYNMVSSAGAGSLADRFSGNGVPCNFDTPPPLIPQAGVIGIAFGVLFKEAASQGFTFNGLMAFGATINSETGSPVEFTILGAMDFLKNPTDPASRMKIAADLTLKYDFVQNVFSGQFNVYLNIMGVLRGIEGENDRAGRMAMYFGRNDWYIYLGNPWGHTNSPGGQLDGMGRYASISFTIPKLGTIGEAGAYFCMGTYGINGLPPLPPNKGVFSIPSDIRTFFERDRPEPDPRSSEGGVAFGAYIGAGYEVGFGPVEAKLNLGFGFDVALVKYSSNVDCRGEDGTFGINGAYARGRIYGYAKGGLYFEWDGDDYEIFSVDMSFAGDFGGPNPTWVDGFVSISNNTLQSVAYDVSLGLGGVVDAYLDDDKYTHIDIKLGKECKPSASASFDDKYGSISPVAYITPDNNGKIEPFSSVVVELNKPLSSVWTLSKDNTEAHDEAVTLNEANRFSNIPARVVPASYITYKRRWFVKEVKLMRGSSDLMNLTTHFGTSENQKELSFLLYNSLASTTLLRVGDAVKFRIVFGIEQQIDNGSWNVLDKYKDNTQATITEEVNLTVGATNYELTPADVVFSYPVEGQKYFLKGHTLNAFVKLTRHFPELKDSNKGLVFKVFSNDELIHTGSFVYDRTGGSGAGGGKITYTLPNTVPNSSTIRVEFYVSGQSPLQIKAPISTTSSKGAAVPNVVLTKIHALNFRTSKYNTFNEKMANARLTKFWHESMDNYTMTATVSNDESWDDFEMYQLRTDVPQGNYEDRYRQDRQGQVFRGCVQVSTKLNTAWHNSLIPIFDEEYRRTMTTPWEEYASNFRVNDFKINQNHPIAIASMANDSRFLKNKKGSELFEKVNAMVGLSNLQPMVPPKKAMAEAARGQAANIENSMGNLIRNNPNLVIETTNDADGFVLNHNFNQVVRREMAEAPTAGNYDFVMSYTPPTIDANGDVNGMTASATKTMQVQYEGFAAAMGAQAEATKTILDAFNKTKSKKQ